MPPVAGNIDASDPLPCCVCQAELPEDPYPFTAVDDAVAGVRGSCATYHERVPVTELVGALSLGDAMEK